MRANIDIKYIDQDTNNFTSSVLYNILHSGVEVQCQTEDNIALAACNRSSVPPKKIPLLAGPPATSIIDTAQQFSNTVNSINSIFNLLS